MGVPSSKFTEEVYLIDKHRVSSSRYSRPAGEDIDPHESPFPLWSGMCASARTLEPARYRIGESPLRKTLTAVKRERRDTY
ncbi:hypothetical protein FA13DRAFT_1736388 [Coprinellus micaceus]|uniref:Uncharacterized protein n=1 Tax=Coprinellus micaceus TaxID=71717 RepID=A0A4Y7T1Y9_COPMI|nr:hypothetical protein FA13DRAFT_1736388 [Coprinellus micaceus]